MAKQDIKEFLYLFPKQEVVDRLYMFPSYDGREANFRIYVLPLRNGLLEYAVFDNSIFPSYPDRDAVLVYTGYQGWLYEGKWQNDFDKLVKGRRKEKEDKVKDKTSKEAEKAAEKAAKDQTILDTYH
jgi:hypothetical protein